MYVILSISISNDGGTQMAVKLELYRVFHEVARMGNISAAAQNLFISQ